MSKARKILQAKLPENLRVVGATREGTSLSIFSSATE